MALPKLNVPTYNLKLPISKQEIVFRPYLTKEEKLLLMAMESKDSKTIISAITQVASNCVVIPEKFDVEKIPMIDIEYLFLHLRAKSKSEVLEAKFECKHVPDEAEKHCGNILTFATRVDNLTVDIPENFDTSIKLTDTIGLIMTLPKYKDVVEATFSAMEKTDNDESAAAMVEETFRVLKKSIVSIYDGDAVYDVVDSKPEELDEFIDSLTSEQYKKIEAFFDNLPKINYKFKVTCARCSYEHNINFKDIASFF